MKVSIKLIHWLPRIICILAILFISMFALDAFNPEKTIWQQIGDFLIHLIPSFVLIIILIIAWKREFIGGIIFIIVTGKILETRDDLKIGNIVGSNVFNLTIISVVDILNVNKDLFNTLLEGTDARKNISLLLTSFYDLNRIFYKLFLNHTCSW